MNHVIFITHDGVCLNYQQLHRMIYRGIIPYIFYIKNHTHNKTNSIILNYLQYHSKISDGIIPLIYYATRSGCIDDQQMFNTIVYAGIVEYVFYNVEFYFKKGGHICVDYHQFKNKIYAGLIINTVNIYAYRDCLTPKFSVWTSSEVQMRIRRLDASSKNNTIERQTHLVNKDVINNEITPLSSTLTAGKHRYSENMSDMDKISYNDYASYKEIIPRASKNNF